MRILLSLLGFLLCVNTFSQNCGAYFTSNASGLVVSFNDSSFSNTLTYTSTWDFGDSSTSNLSNPNHTFQTSGRYSVCLSIQDTTNCTDVYCDSISVIAPCSASYTYSVDTNNLVTFSNNSIVPPGVTYAWDFGDSSSIDTSQNPSHWFAVANRYLVSLTLSGSGTSCTYFDTVYVNYCSASFLSQVSPTGNVLFNNTSHSSPYTSFSWDFGDNNTSSLENPIHSYTNSGVFPVSLSLYDSISGCTSSSIDSIWVNVPPVCQAGFNTLINQDSLFITNTASNFNVINYDFGDSNSSSLLNPIHIYKQSGTYIVCQTVEDSSTSCLSIFCDTINISVPPSCQAGFTHSINQQTIQLQNTASNFDSILYYFGDGDSSNIANPSHTYLQGGNFVVCQLVYNSITNCQAMFCDSISISNPCLADFSYTTNKDTVHFTNLSVNFSSLSYQFGDGDSSTTENPSHVYTQSGVYLACLTVLDSSTNCSNTICDSIRIGIPSSCKAGFNYNISGDTVLFTNTASTYNRIVYYFGDGDTSILENPSHIYQQSGTYIVTQKVINDTTNCTNIYLDTIAVSVSQSCVAMYQIAIDTNKRSTLYLVNISTNDNSHRYFWTFGDGQSASGRTPSHNYSNFGKYEICLRVSDSILNCTSTYCDTVGLDSNGNVLKTNGFTLKVIDGVFIGIEESNELEISKIYPNPFADYIQVVSKYKEINYSLIDLSGRVHKEGSLTQSESRIDLSYVPKGIYFIRLNSEQKSVIKKLIKK